jgi:hypothetical protein
MFRQHVQSMFIVNKIQCKRSFPNYPLFGPTGGHRLNGDGDGSHDLGEPRATSTPRFKSTLSLLKLILRAFAGIVTTPGAVIEVFSSDQVEPFKNDRSEAATALPIIGPDFQTTLLGGFEVQST